MSRRRLLTRGAGPILALLLVAGPGRLAAAQGCAQCRDNVGSTRPETQQGYREAIGLLAGTAVAICAAVAFVARQPR